MNKPRFFVVKSTAALRITAGMIARLSVLDLLALARWAIFQEIDWREAEHKSLNYDIPTPEERFDIIEDLESEAENLKEENTREVEALKEQHETDLANLKEEHDKAIQELKEKHQQELVEQARTASEITL